MTKTILYNGVKLDVIYSVHSDESGEELEIWADEVRVVCDREHSTDITNLVNLDKIAEAIEMLLWEDGRGPDEVA